MLYSANMVGKSKRIFLMGDPMLGDMCRETDFCSRTKEDDELSAFTVKLKPNFSSPSNWSNFEMHTLNGAPQITVYHLSQSKKQYIHIFEKELFWSFRPRVNDILIILFGAHFRGEKVILILRVNVCMYVCMCVYLKGGGKFLNKGISETCVEFSWSSVLAGAFSPTL